MNIFSLKENLKTPFMGVKWDTENGKIITKTEAWDALLPEIQSEAMAMADWDFLSFNGSQYFKYVVPHEKSGYQTYFLLPADEWYNDIQKIEKLETDLAQTREQLLGFVQNVPIPLLVVTNDAQNKISFANNLLLNFFQLPLSSLYKGLALEDFFHSQTPNILALFSKAQKTRQPVQEVIQLQDKGENEYKIRHLLLRVFPFKTSFMDGSILGIVDLTKEKQQEYELQEAYNEMQAQAESLSEAYDALSELHETLKKERQLIEIQKKELESSIQAASRYQNKVLLNKNFLSALEPHYSANIEMHTHSIVGGDFLLVVSENLNLPEWHFIVLADATGHGPLGAMLALTLSLLLRTQLLGLKNIEKLHTVLEVVHAQLLDILDAKEQVVSSEGAEIALIALPKSFAKDNNAYCSLAGRPLYVFQSSLQQLSSFQHSNRAVGFFVKDAPTPAFQTQVFSFKTNDVLFVFSDGFTDQFNSNGNKIGKKRATQWLHEVACLSTFEKQFQFLFSQWKEWKGEAPQTDDMILLAIQKRGL
jgi:serine phosphatase RsbU (regulator of sigma subunit)